MIELDWKMIQLGIGFNWELDWIKFKLIELDWKLIEFRIELDWKLIEFRIESDWQLDLTGNWIGLGIGLNMIDE